MSLKQQTTQMVKKRILASFRKQKHMVREDDTIEWSDLCTIMRTLDPDFCTDDRLAELRRSAGINVIAHPAESNSTRIKLEPFINWIFVDAEVQKANVAAGNLRYVLSEENVDEAKSLVDEVVASEEIDPVQRVQQVFRRFWVNSRCPVWPKRGQLQHGDRHLFVAMTDLEPDDVMAIAELWEWKSEKRLLDGEPLIVFHANFAKKDGGMVLEKKQLLVSLMLGLSKYYTLTKEGDDGSDVYSLDGAHHPQQQQIIDRRSQYLDEICEELENFDGPYIDFYILSPGAGNIGAILQRLKDRGTWPLQAKWKVSMYSGSFNMRGMAPEDIDAIREIMTTCADGPLVDVGKFPFFGGKDCHPWTDSLTTFAMPSFASDLSFRSPHLAAMLKLFNDEFNAVLIDPDNKSIWAKGQALTAEEEVRFEDIKARFQHTSTDKLQEYARALWEDEAIRAKLAEYKKSTFKAYAYGGCDSPLCDQLLFLSEWLEQEQKDYLVFEEGYWSFNVEKGFTEILPTSDDQPGAFLARRPKLAFPRQEEHLLDMRYALESYLVRHLYSLDCHISKQAGRLTYIVPNKWAVMLDFIVDKVRTQGMERKITDTNGIITSCLPEWRPLAVDDERDRQDRLMLVYSDMEPDDSMAIAQLWEWKNEVQKMRRSPMLIFACDFASKEGGKIYEKKNIMISLMLGVSQYYTLTPESDNTGRVVNEHTKDVHPLNPVVQGKRQAELERICQDLIDFNGNIIDFYVIAPGLGNLGAIINRLMDTGHWPLPSNPKWRIYLYSGGYNMGGMTQADILAMTEIMRHADQPLVDVGKFPFFGGKKAHAWTDALTTFASPHLATEISNKYPLLAACLLSFNDEFNAALVNPHLKDLFKKNPLSEEELARYAEYKAGFVWDQGETVRKFCKDVVQDEPVFQKLPDFKKSTFLAFAHGGCDSPLCDQLLFLYEYLIMKSPDSLTMETGLWFYDSNGSGFTMVREDQGRFPAVRPVLKDPLDEVILEDLRRVMEHYLLQHLDEIKKREQPHLKRVSSSSTPM